MNALALAPVLVPLLGAALLLLLPHRHQRLQELSCLFISVMHCVVAVLLYQEAAHSGVSIIQIGSWSFPFGIGILVDKFAVLMVGITALIGLTTVSYSIGSIPPELVRRHYYPLVQFLLAGVSGAFLAGDLFNLFVWFEVLLMASFVLLTLGRTAAQAEAGVKYLIINFMASSLFLIGAGLAFGEFGTLSMVDLGARIAAAPPSGTTLFIGGLLFIAFAVKAGAFPVYSWLPASYHTPPPAVTALFAGLLTKVGIFALYRTATLLFPTYHHITAPLCLIVGVCTMVTGVFGAVAQMNIRKVLSFHIISQIGYMILALGFWSTTALAAGIFYTLHHIVVKTNLFFLAGIIQRLTGTEQLTDMGGLYKKYPYLAILFLVPALSLSGVPPLSGFFAKFSLISAGFEGQYLTSAGIALAVGLLTFYSMTKIWNEAFWKAAPSDTPKVDSLPGISWMIGSALILALGTLSIGIFPDVLWSAAYTAAELMHNPSLYLRAAGGGTP